jgi:hypothetical protein
MLANVYVPLDAAKGMQVLQDLGCRAQRYSQAGYGVVVAGDLNAHVADRDDRPVDADGVPVQGLCPRASRAGERINQYGTAVIDMCHTAGLALLTGRGPGGNTQQAVQVSYSLAGRSSRPDHVLVSLHMVCCVEEHLVQTSLQDVSDHMPLLTTLSLPAGPAEATGPPAATGPAVRLLLWDAGKREEYMECVADSEALAAQLQEFDQLLEAGSLQAAVDALHGVAMRAGEVAGMRVVTAGRVVRRRRHHQPWFDSECRAAKARVAALPRALKQDYKQLRALFQRKRRAWWVRTNAEVDAECEERGQRSLWRDMRRGVSRGMPNVCSVSRHLEHLAGKFSGPGVTAGAAGVEGGSLHDMPTELEVHEVINDATVSLALQKLNKQAAVGIPGVPVQALGAPKLLRALVQLLQAVYRAGYEPCSMKEGLLVPVHKRGDLSEPGSYRPIVVSSLLHKLYAWCINHALRKWMRSQPGQPRDLLPRHCGFLPHRSTLHNLFMLSNAMHHSVVRREQLCVLLLDIASAFDSVNHASMIHTLQELGVPAHLVRAVHGMYQGLQYRMCTADGRLTEPLDVGVGVKQGCPASPLLFCLFVQPVSVELAAVQELEVYQLEGHSLPDWAYADDFVLLAHSTAGLQHLTGSAARAFLQRWLRVEPAKCVMLGVAVPDEESVTVDGHQVPRAPPEGQRYLGVVFDQAATPATMARNRARCMQSAFRVARGRLHASDAVISCMPVILRVLNTAVAPAGLYACEVWGLGTLPHVGGGDFGLPHFYALSDPMEMERCGLLRGWLRLPRSTPKACLLHELGLQPLSHEYTRRAVRFWNTLVRMPATSPYRMALVQNVADAFHSNRGTVVNFTSALYIVLRLLGVVNRPESHLRGLNTISVDDVDRQLLAKYSEWVTHALVGGGMIGWYFRDVGRHEVGTRPAWYHISVPHKVAVSFLRFRLGCHHLRINTGRWQVPVLDRAARKCLRCAAVFENEADVPVDDETHCLINCQEPVLALHRMQLEAELRRFDPHAATNSMQELLSAVHETGRKRLMRMLMGFVARCYRVARSCHENLAEWQGGREVQRAVAVHLQAEWLLHQERLYAAGAVPGLPSDTTVDESSDLEEVTMPGPVLTGGG